MNRLYLVLAVAIVLFLLIRFFQIKEYGSNRELFSSDLTDVSLPINNIDNFGLKKLHNEPQIILIDNFLTEEECNHIINVGDPLVRKSEVCGKSGSRPDKSRTSWTAHIGKQLITKDKKDKVLMNVYEKAARFCNRTSKNIEPIQLVRYTPGQYFKSHYDYLDTRVPMYKKNVERNGQREVTFFVYLNDVPEGVGGETHFKKINKTFKGKKGQAVFWYNIKDGKEDPLTLHSGTEIKEGTKYGLNIWVRNKEYKG
jgi:prolyl 4-hydroxylase